MTLYSCGDIVSVKIYEQELALAAGYVCDYKHDFEIIGIKNEEYILYVPSFLYLKGAVYVYGDRDLQRHGLPRKYDESYIHYISDAYIVSLFKKVDGMKCKDCQEFYEMSAPNQADGTLICYNCRHYKFYK